MNFSPTVGPPDVFKNQPVEYILDLNWSIKNLQQDLYPFQDIVILFSKSSELADELKACDKQCVVTLLSSTFTAQNVQSFFGEHIHPNRSIDSYYLFFPNGHLYETEMLNFYGHRLKACGQVENDFLRNILSSCSYTCDLIISYYEKHVEKSKHENNSSLVRVYARQLNEFLKMKMRYIEKYKKILEDMY